MADPLCKITDIPVNGLKQVEAGGRSICIANAGGRFFACQAACPHEGIALCEGAFDGEVLTCLEHLWSWSVVEGGEPRGLAEQPLEMIEVEQKGDALYLKG
jgi:toluene monooxygenase system ferredoxin subunit